MSYYNYFIIIDYFKRNFLLLVYVSGVLVINPVASYLTNKFGWRNSFRILGCSSFFLAFTSVSFFPAFPEDHLLGRIEVKNLNKINQTPGLFYQLFKFKKIENKIEKKHSLRNSSSGLNHFHKIILCLMKIDLQLDVFFQNRIE